ncbi:MAG: ParA family protein [Spirochaetia bacterium]|nr:ParA family protein [Spirochaetia bacterium]
MKIITVANLKGGVSKTSLAVNLAFILKNSLLIDFDGQASATDYLLRETDVDELEKRNAYLMLREKLNPVECIFKGLTDCIPAVPELHKIGIEMVSEPMATLRVIDRIKKMTDYDYIIIDTPPAITYQLSLSISLADLVLIPATYDRWTIRGLSMILSEIEKSGNRETLVVPSIISQADDEKFRKIMAGRVSMSKTTIKRSNSVRNAAALGKPVSGAMASLFQELAGEVA